MLVSIENPFSKLDNRSKSVCRPAGGGIIDLLNKRLRDRLKEAEILSIFVDVCEAVAFMHSLPKPLLHRDLKVRQV